MSVNISIVQKLTQAVRAAADKIVKETENTTDDMIVKIASSIVAAVAGVFGDAPPDLPENVVLEAYRAAEEIKSEIGL